MHRRFRDELATGRHASGELQLCAGLPVYGIRIDRAAFRAFRVVGMSAVPEAVGRPGSRACTAAAPFDRADGSPLDALVECPECGLPAEIVDRRVVDSTAGPVEHVKTLCVHRHWFLLPAEWVPGLAHSS